MELKVDENILFYAFRYALGRRTYAVKDVTETLRRLWPQLTEKFRWAVQKEIREAGDCVGLSLGSKADAEEWLKILELPI